MHPSSDFKLLMREGTSLHRDGKPEQALVCFERARALEPDNPNAANACATLLTSLGQPQAAYAVLLAVERQLLADADSAANLAIAAETCGEHAKATAAYARALELDPKHQRSLNNTALVLADQGDFPAAVTRMQRCVELAPGDAGAISNLADMLIGARRFGDAVNLLADAVRRLPQSDALAVRHLLALAFDGRIDEAHSGIQALDPARKAYFSELLKHANTEKAHHLTSLPARVPDAYDLFCQQAFEALQVCDWHDRDRLTAVLREMLGRSLRTGQVRDWRDAQFYGLMLPLPEDEMAQLRRISMDGIAKQLAPGAPPFKRTRFAAADGRIHIGLATSNLRDPRVLRALERQLALHDRSRFALHLYSATPQPDPGFATRVLQFGVPLVEIGHMTNDEAVGRIRLDSLDIFIDMAFNTPWCRPEILERRVAPLQTRQITWHRHNLPRQCDYNMSDVFVHPPEIDMESYSAVIRLPHSFWLLSDDTPADDSPVQRADVGLPEDALVLCCFIPPVMVDPQSFANWMKLLIELPGAVLWLPAYPALARGNLAAAAQAAGIDAARIHHLPPGSRGQTLARIRLADLFVDTVRFNANHGLVDALRMGVPALTCAGNDMASRLGGSILRAAGLPESVFSTSRQLVQAAIALGTDPLALAALRQRVALARSTAPLFQPQARIREWEWAWTAMVQRHRVGLPAAAFDVPDQSDAAVAPAALTP